MTLTLASQGPTHGRTAAAPAPATEAERLRLEVEQLRDKLAGQPVIEQAKGILMLAFGLTAENAFDVLRMLSQDSNVRLRQVARCVVDSWTRCGPRPGFDAAAGFLKTLREALRATVGEH
ncbi:ANTAR domain-containing protein [Mycolicibacterium sp. XJ662]